MGVGKTERASLYDSRFTIGRRSDAANDRIIRNLKVKGGRIRKIGDKWTITLKRQTISPGGYPSAWELTIDGDTATCVNCMLMLSTVTVMAAGDQMQLTCDLSEHTDGWLCGVIHGSTKEVSLDFREPTTEMNEEQDEIVFPLYRVIKKDDVWRIAVDVRAMPRIGAYW
jgi:hypothetical protein